jgi:hypothetical protein
MAFDHDFPGRGVFVWHAMREFRNRLPDAVAGEIGSSSLEYKDLADQIQQHWGEDGWPSDGAVPLSDPTEPSASGPARHEVSRDLLLAVGRLVAGHAAIAVRNQANAQRLVEAVAGSAAPTYVAPTCTLVEASPPQKPTASRCKARRRLRDDLIDNLGVSEGDALERMRMGATGRPASLVVGGVPLRMSPSGHGRHQDRPLAVDGAAGQDALAGRSSLPGRARADQRVAGQAGRSGQRRRHGPGPARGSGAGRRGSPAARQPCEC